MTDPTAIIGTIDLLAKRLTDLRLRYNNWSSNPEEHQRLLNEYKQYFQHVTNLDNKVKELGTHNSKEMNLFMESIKSLFDKSKQDLIKLEKTFGEVDQDIDVHSRSDSDETVIRTEGRHSIAHHTQPNLACQSPKNGSNDCGITMKVRRPRFKNSSRQPSRNLKSFTRVKRDTEILKTVDDRLREGRSLLANVSILTLLHEAKTLDKRDTPKFIQHFDRPFLSENWVVDFSRIQSNPDPEAVQTCNPLIGKTITSEPIRLSQEVQIKQILLSFLRNPHQSSQPDHPKTIPSLCIHGNGGMGKSVVLQSICHDQQIQKAFSDGIHFLTLGQNAKSQDVIHQFSMCARHAGYEKISKEIMFIKSAEDAAREVSLIFKGKRVLFVVDDLWINEESGTGFLREIKTMGGMSEGATLFSTRDEKLGREGRKKLFFDFLAPKGEVSRMILGSCVKRETNRGRERDVFESLDEEAVKALDKILELCGGWKLCLAVAGGTLSEYTRACYNDLSQGLTTYAEMLEEYEEELIYGTTSDYHEQNLTTIAQSSIRRCKEWIEKEIGTAMLKMEEMFRSLCVIEKQKWMGMGEICKMWGVNERYGDQLLRQMERMNILSLNLATGDDLNQFTGRSREKKKNREWKIRLHDRMIDVCVNLAKADDDEGTKRWHKLLLDRYLPRTRPKTSHTFTTNIPETTRRTMCDRMCAKITSRKWWDERAVSEPYLMKNLSRHLEEGGLLGELFFLVTDVRWTLRRLRDGGWPELRIDFDRLSNCIMNLKKTNACDKLMKHIVQQLDGIHLLRDLLRNCWSNIQQRKHQIGFEMLGRIQDEETELCALSRYVSSIEEHGPRPWLRPLRLGALRRKDGRQQLELQLGRDFMSCAKICVSPNGEYVVTVETLIHSATMFLTNLLTQEKKQIELELHHNLFHSNFSFDFCFATSYMALGFLDGTIQIRDAKRGTIVGTLMHGHMRQVTCVSFNESGSHLASGSADKVVRLWNVCTSKAVGKPFVGHSEEITCVQFAPSGNCVVSGSEDGTLQIWNINTGLGLGRLLMSDNDVIKCSAISSDGNLIVSGSQHGVVHIWDLTKRAPIGNPLVAHKGPITCVAFSQDGTRIVTGSSDYTARAWDVRTGVPIGLPFRHKGWISCVALNRDGSELLSVSCDGISRLWDVQANLLTTEPVTNHDDPVSFVTFIKDSHLALSGSVRGTVRIWNVENGLPLGKSLIGQKKALTCATMHEEREYVVSGAKDGTILIWDVRTSILLGHFLTAKRSSVTCLALSHDGCLLASGSDDMMIRIWNLDTMSAVRHPLKGHDGWIVHIAFSRDDTRLISGSSDNTMRLWDIQNGSEICSPFYVERLQANDLIFSQYRKWLEEQFKYLQIHKRTTESHLCMKVLHRDTITVLRETGFIIADRFECRGGKTSCCATEDPKKVEDGEDILIVDSSSVSLSLPNEDLLELASTSSSECFSFGRAIREYTTSHGLCDGTVLFSKLQL